MIHTEGDAEQGDGVPENIETVDDFIPPRSRLEALARTDLLDSATEESFDRLTRLVAHALNVPVALMSLVDDRRQFFKSAQGLQEPWATARETPLSHSFCQHVVATAEPLIVEDARTHPLVADNGAITDLGVIAYLGVPLHDPHGHVLGSLCAIDGKPRVWSAEDRALLEDYAALIDREVGLRAEINRRRGAEEKGSLVARELSHRIKNIFTVVASLVSLSARGHPEASAFAETISARIDALARAHDYVQRNPAEARGDREAQSLQGLIQALMTPYMELERRRISIGACGEEIGRQSVTTLALVLHELATNAVKYGALSRPSGHVAIHCEAQGPDLMLVWEEEGGPKIAGEPTQQGFGTILSQRAATRQLGARITHEWRTQGLRVSMLIPLSKLAQ